MERVEVDEPILPPDLISVADPPAHGVEHGHHHAAGEDKDPSEHQEVSDEDEDHAGWKNNGSVHFIPLAQRYL